MILLNYLWFLCVCEVCVFDYMYGGARSEVRGNFVESIGSLFPPLCEPQGLILGFQS